MNIYELLRVIDLVGRFDVGFRSNFPVAGVNGHWTILSAVVRYEIEGRPLTLTGLITASGLPHATAIRRINALVEEGLILCEPRTASGKTFRYRPSPDLMDRFARFAGEVKRELAGFLDSGGVPQVRADDYYFGGRHQQQAYTDAHLRELLRVPDVSKVRFLAHQDWFFMALRHAWSDLRRRIGMAQNFELHPLMELQVRIDENAARAQSDFDLIALTPNSLREMAAAGQLAPLPALGEALSPYYDRIHPIVWNMAEHDGRTYGVPGYVTLDILAARRDLFDEARIGFPNSLSKLVAAARILHQPRRRRYGIVWSGSAGFPIAKSFLLLRKMAGNSPAFSERAPGSPHPAQIFGAPGAVAYEAMLQLLEVSPPDVLSCDEEHIVARFGAGEAAMCLTSSLNATRFEFDISSAVKHRVSYLSPVGSLRGEHEMFEGHVLAVPANLAPERRERAFSVLRWLSAFDLLDNESDGKIPSSPLFSLTSDPEMARNSPIRNLIFLLVRQRRVRMRPSQPHPSEIVRLETFGHALHAGLTARVPWESMLANAGLDPDGWEQV